MGTMMVAFGYIYPLQDHKKLIIKSDPSLYRFQVTLIHLLVNKRTQTLTLLCTLSVFSNGIYKMKVVGDSFTDTIFLGCTAMASGGH